MIMKFKEIVSRITGFSTAVFGLSWNPPEPEVTTARRVLTFLEDRRVFRNVIWRDDVESCVQSVLKIREYLTTELGNLASKSDLEQSLRAMRAACRKFLDRAQGLVPQKKRAVGNLPSHQGAIFNNALGELRGVFGMYIRVYPD
jgi:hypothetical protein